MNRTIELLIATSILCSVAHAQPTRDDALAALRQAGAFYRGQVSTHGGYVWQVSGDLKLRKGEGLTDEHTIWVQPPGTTEVGLAFMDAYYATGEQMFLDAAVHESAMYALDAISNAQYPVGAWGHNYCRYPNRPPGEDHYPIIPASVPLSSPESWPNAWNGCYFINDNVTPDVCRAYLEAWWIYRDERYLRVAQKAGVFMLLAQMPEPQPAWCQQYDENMQPVWDRKFEPPPSPATSPRA